MSTQYPQFCCCSLEYSLCIVIDSVEIQAVTSMLSSSDVRSYEDLCLKVNRWTGLCSKELIIVPIQKKYVSNTLLLMNWFSKADIEAVVHVHKVVNLNANIFLLWIILFLYAWNFSYF